MSEAADAQPDRDAPWTFTITWDPERGAVPWPIMSLFRGTPRGGIRPGRATRVTDRGHATFYAKAVEQHVAKYWADRTDITATAEPQPEAPAPVKRCHWCSAEATGTALAPLWENGRVVSRLGGRFASCEQQHGTGYTPFTRPEEATR